MIPNVPWATGGRHSPLLRISTIRPSARTGNSRDTKQSDRRYDSEKVLKTSRKVSSKRLPFDSQAHPNPTAIN